MNIAMKLALESAMEKARRARTKDAAIKALETFAAEWLRDRRVKLSDAKRQDILNRAATGETVQEISAAIEISVPTVRKVLARKAGKGWGR